MGSLRLKPNGYDEYVEYLKSPTWAAKRIEVFKHHGKSCKKCTETRSLHVHHITYKNLTNEDVEKDLIPLCKKCHKKLHKLQRKRKLSVYHATFQFLEREPPPKTLKRKPKAKKKPPKKKTKKYKPRNTYQKLSPKARLTAKREIESNTARASQKNTTNINLAKLMQMYDLSEEQAKRLCAT